ncbi:MAG: MGMT family protein [Planctomycetes bacterium]|nr:MGMT family protein [Planctomycetota bacterium]
MAKTKKSWREKLADSKDLPKFIKPKGRGAAQYGDKMLVPSPIQVDAMMKKVRKGKVMTIAQLREKLTKDNKATSTCPLCSGIFAWISANAAQESEDDGRKRITPWWRTVKAKGELNPKYPGGMEEQAKRLRKEGHKIVKKGKRWFVEGI